MTSSSASIDRRAVPLPAAVLAHADALDVPGAQRAAAVQQPPLDDGRVADELAVVPGQRVDAAEAVLPVVVVEVALEHLVEQRPGGREHDGLELRGVGDLQRPADRRRAHPAPLLLRRGSRTPTRTRR